MSFFLDSIASLYGRISSVLLLPLDNVKLCVLVLLQSASLVRVAGVH